jgi:hypothetical protein
LKNERSEVAILGSGLAGSEALKADDFAVDRFEHPRQVQEALSVLGVPPRLEETAAVPAMACAMV